MKGKFWANVALFAAVIALALLAWLKPTARESEFKLSAIKAADAKNVRLEVNGAPAVALERTTTDWKITAPLVARADAFQVQRMLGILDAVSKDRYPATGLARFDLNEPYAKLTVNQQTFSFGAINPVSREQYVQTQDAVYLVGMQYGANLPKSTLQLASKQLFSADEAPVAFEFAEFGLAEREGKWQLTPAADVGPDDINRWVDEWRLASAIGIMDRSNRKPLATIKVKLRGGGDLTLAVLQREPDLIIARSDQAYEYQFAGAVARRLLAPPAASSAK